ncbi:MAG: ABC transporter permease [Candidatus Yonathbacteria bacterium]|nr:ABC transporter permease [Candidatus Yonathbacteria bacterium]
MSTIYILWLRQLKRQWRSRARMIGSLGQPLLFLLALGFGFGPIYAKAGGGSYIEFIGPGVVAMGIIFTSIFSGIEVIWDRQFGFLKETLVAPVSRTHIMIGRTLGGATVATIQGTLVLVIACIAGFKIVSFSLLPFAILFMILTALVFTAFGTVIAINLSDMQAFPIIMNFVVMPLFFLSGALFPLNGFPHSIVIASRFNPLVYGVDGLRGALTGASNFSLGIDIIALALIALAFIGIGSLLFSKVEV